MQDIDKRFKLLSNVKGFIEISNLSIAHSEILGLQNFASTHKKSITVIMNFLNFPKRIAFQLVLIP